MERSLEKGSKQSPSASLALGQWVTVGLVYRPKGETEWLPVEAYEPWAGQIMSLPKHARVNGNINVMPRQPREGSDFPEYENGHPKVCDVSPRGAVLSDGMVVEFRHDVVPLEKGPNTVPTEAE